LPTKWSSWRGKFSRTKSSQILNYTQDAFLKYSITLLEFAVNGKETADNIQQPYLIIKVTNVIRSIYSEATN
jgi:hypothetical protein